jgi:hypothetical protein
MMPIEYSINNDQVRAAIERLSQQMSEFLTAIGRSAGDRSTARMLEPIQRFGAVKVGSILLF